LADKALRMTEAVRRGSPESALSEADERALAVLHLPRRDLQTPAHRAVEGLDGGFGRARIGVPG